MTIVYLSNCFPEAVEPYVWDEICELRRHAQVVLPCSIKRPHHIANPEAAEQTLYAAPLRTAPWLRATWSCVRDFAILKEVLVRAISGPEPIGKRLRALAHTWLGVYLAVRLRDRHIAHMHVHHGYFAAWVGMVAARVLNVDFSMTLHGSDVLLGANYLDIKLKNCKFCVTVSEFNRRYLLNKYPQVDPNKIVVHRIGIDLFKWISAEPAELQTEPLILSVGRLHPVKNYSFLVQACRTLKDSGVTFHCVIAGEGEERPRLERLIRTLDLWHEVTLLGQVAREELPALYAKADVAVLTSSSEGIPLTLMEAMAMEKLVLAPAITGIPELITHNETGFLYWSGSINDFVQKLRLVLMAGTRLNHIRKESRRKIQLDFNKDRNLRAFAEDFLARADANSPEVAAHATSDTNENPVLQQI